MRAGAELRRRWVALVVGLPAVHLVVHQLLGLGSVAQLIWTDTLLLCTGATTIVASVRTMLRCRQRHLCIAWAALSAGAILWWIGGALWVAREIAGGGTAPAPSWLDAPFFMLAPTFALALAFYRRHQPSRALQLRNLADLGIIVATITIVGTLVLAQPIRDSGFTPYVIVAIGYPGFYLAVVLFALQLLARGQWGERRIVLGILVWAHFAFASVDLLYGAQVLAEEYQTGAAVDTLWLVGLLSLSWAAVEERTVRDTSELPRERNASWTAVVGGVLVVALAALSADALQRLRDPEWILVILAGLAAAGLLGLRMWASGRLEEDYQGALSQGEQVVRALEGERSNAIRLRALGSMTPGTAHEINNLIQAIGGNLALARRRAARGEPIEVNLTAIERAAQLLADEISLLRRARPVEGGRGTVLVLPDSDPDGQLCAALARSGFAPALLPDVASVVRAAKGEDTFAIVAAPLVADELQRLKVCVPIITTGRDPQAVIQELASLSVS